MHTLKVQLGLTLFVLLFLSMLLFGFVVLMLWQRNGIQQEAVISEKLLHIAAASLATDARPADDTLFQKHLTVIFKKAASSACNGRIVILSSPNPMEAAHQNLFLYLY